MYSSFYKQFSAIKYNNSTVAHFECNISCSSYSDGANLSKYLSKLFHHYNKFLVIFNYEHRIMPQLQHACMRVYVHIKLNNYQISYGTTVLKHRYGCRMVNVVKWYIIDRNNSITNTTKYETSSKFKAKQTK